MAADPYYSDVLLLLHADGANGSTTFVDNSQTPKAVTAAGNAQISTAQSKFGGSSLSLDGVGDYLSVPANGAFSFGTGDFCLEAWIKTTTTAEKYIFDQYSAATNSWQFGIINGKLNWYSRSAGAGSGAYLLSGVISVNDGAWHHIVAARADGVLRFFVDGVADGAAPVTINYNTSGIPLGIGAQVGSRNASYDFPGFIDELRITKGAARYTASFAPITEPFADSDVLGVVSARLSAPSLLSAPLAVAVVVRAARVAGPSPLGNAAMLARAWDVHSAWAATPSPLGSPTLVVEFGNNLVTAKTQSAGPLGAPATVAQLVRVAWAAGPSPLGAARAAVSMAPVAAADTPSPLGEPSVFAAGLVSSYADAPSPLGEPSAQLQLPAVPVVVNAPVIAGAAFGIPALVTIFRVQDSPLLSPFIPSTVSAIGMAPSGRAFQAQSMDATVFGVPSLSSSTSYAAESLVASVQFGVASVRSVYEASSLVATEFGQSDTAPIASYPATSIAGQVAFGQVTSRMVHGMGDWYAGPRISAVSVKSIGTFPVEDGLGPIEIGGCESPGMGYRALSLHANCKFGEITIRRSHSC